MAVHFAAYIALAMIGAAHVICGQISHDKSATSLLQVLLHLAAVSKGSSEWLIQKH